MKQGLGEDRKNSGEELGVGEEGEERRKKGWKKGREREKGGEGTDAGGEIDKGLAWFACFFFFNSRATVLR